MTAKTTPIGVPRLYEGPVLPRLYPGEQASAQLDPQSVAEAFDQGGGELRVVGWLVEPMPGWAGWWLRTRWRIWGRWFSRGQAQLDASVSVEAVQEDAR